jgi:beta-alanine--pyruvate transaminase
VPMGGVIVSSDIYQAFMSGPPSAIEFAHGYTYSAHALACAAGIATLELYRDEGLFERAAKMAPVFEERLHSIKGSRHVIDVRNIGLVGAVELAPRPGAPGSRTYETYLRLYEKGVLLRQTGDILSIAPALIVDEAQVDRIVETLRAVLDTVE